MNPFTTSKTLIEALHLRLSTSVDIQSILGLAPRLYDHAPEDPIYPYLTYGAMRSEDISADETVLSAHTVNLHIWSRYSGRREVVTILTELTRVLQASSLVLEDAKQVSANIVYTDIFRTPDARTLHGILRVNYIIQSELEATL